MLPRKPPRPGRREVFIQRQTGEDYREPLLCWGKSSPAVAAFLSHHPLHIHTHHEHATDSFTSIANARFHSSRAVLLACWLVVRGTFLPNLLWRLQDEREENQSQTFPAPDLGDYVELRGKERQIVYRDS